MTIIYADGGCGMNGSRDASTYGSYSVDGHVTRLKFNSGTNNTAEYMTLISALAHCRKENIRNAIVFMDSALVVNQVSGRWKVRDDELRPLTNQARELVRETGAQLIWVARARVVEELGH